MIFLPGNQSSFNVKNLAFGIIGMSEGNGHPYSWSAIFNGYDPAYMKDCPFPVIPDYLSQQEFPQDAIQTGRVTHIWTQDRGISEHIARAARIPVIVDQLEELVGQVDAVLLARDDPASHFAMARPFLEAGMPIYIDKPLAASVKEAEAILAAQQYKGQVFSCSALRYAQEFQWSEALRHELGKVRLLDATIPKRWETYAVHLIEPALGLLPERGKLRRVVNTGKAGCNLVTVYWEHGQHAVFKVLGTTCCPLSIRLFGEKSYRELVFKDTYAAFKSALEAFMQNIDAQRPVIPRAETMEIVEIIERGMPKS